MPPSVRELSPGFPRAAPEKKPQKRKNSAAMALTKSVKLRMRKGKGLRNGRYEGLGRGWRKGLVAKNTKRGRGDKKVTTALARVNFSRALVSGA